VREPERMNTIVCIKQVPEVADADLSINKEGAGIDREDLVMGINEWDNYAVEEAIRIKEARGGEVTVVTLGEEDAEDVLRRALAMGADEAIRIDDEKFEGSDAVGIARGLFRTIQPLPFDLVLTGAQSSDDGWAQVGLVLAEMLSLPYASLVVDITIQAAKLIVKRELESNTQEQVELPLPALISIQTGINDPRYVSIMGIRKVRGIQIQKTGAGELGLSEDEIGIRGSSIASLSLSLPPEGEGAEILTGSLSEICERTAQIIRDKGGVS
jgi:electron transfer flavoprotein beta subunit